MSDTLILETVPATSPKPGPVSHRTFRIPSVVTWLRRNAVVAVSAVVLLLAVGFALFPSVFASGDPLRGVPAEKLQGPSVAHWFGTDNLGRDVYTRVVHGAGLSLTATLVAVGIALVVGSLVGLLSGALGGGVDAVLMRIVDVLLSIPALLLSLALVTALGFGTMNVAIAVGVSLVANFARVMRSEVLRVRKALYVEAAFACGVPCSAGTCCATRTHPSRRSQPWNSAWRCWLCRRCASSVSVPSRRHPSGGRSSRRDATISLRRGG